MANDWADVLLSAADILNSGQDEKKFLVIDRLRQLNETRVQRRDKARRAAKKRKRGNGLSAAEVTVTRAEQLVTEKERKEQTRYQD